MKLPFVVFVALLTGGCATHAPLWEKLGGSIEQQSQDIDSCRALAHAVLRRDLGIDADLTSTMGHDWQATGMLSMEKQSLYSTSLGYARWIFDRCMEKKGYFPTEAHR